MKTPCKTSYGFYRLPTKVYCKLWNLTICKVFCFGQFHMSFCSQAGSQSIGFSMKIRYCFHFCQHLCQSAQTFSLRDIIKYCTYINSPMFQNLYPFILRQDKATSRWKEILMSRTAIAIAREFLSKLGVYSYWVHFHLFVATAVISTHTLQIGGQAFSSE